LTDRLQIASNSANIWWLKLKNFLLSFRVWTNRGAL
jgi:hypothetical protein